MRRLMLFIFIGLATQTGARGGQTADPYKLYEEAVASMAEENWPEAILKLETILAAEPSHVPSRFNLAISLSGDGNRDRAIDTYREVLALDPQMFEAWMNLASLLHGAERWDEAIDALARAADQRSNDPVPILYRAELLDQAGRLTEAEQSYRQVLEMDPDSMEAQYRLGFLYLQTQRPDRAYEAFLEAARLGSADPTVYLALGDFEAQQNDLESAKRRYTEASSLAPESEAIRLRLALVLRDLGEFTEAIALLQDLPGGVAVIGEIYYSNRDFAAATPIYEGLVIDEPGNAEYWFVLGNCYYETGLMDRAVPALKRGLEIEPLRIQGWATLAAIYITQEDWANAETALVRHLEVRPDHAPSHLALATTLDRLENFERALIHYDRFLELAEGPDDLRTFEVLERVEALNELLESR